MEREPSYKDNILHKMLSLLLLFRAINTLSHSLCLKDIIKCATSLASILTQLHALRQEEAKSLSFLLHKLFSLVWKSLKLF